MAQKTKEEQEREERAEKEQKERERQAKQDEQKEKQAAEKKAKMPAHVQQAHQEVTQLSDRASKALEKIKFRLADGTYTEQELAELQVTLEPTLEKMGGKKTPAKSQKELQDEPVRPAELGKPRPEMQKSRSNVEHMIEQCLANMERQQEKISNVESSEEEILEARQSYQDMVNKLERLAGGTNPAEA